MIRLGFDELLAATGAHAAGRTEGVGDLLLRGVSTDTRLLQPGELFVALTGPNHDGNRFAAQAVERGAGALLLAEDAPLPPGGLGVPVARVASPRRALGELGAWYRARLHADVIGITGSCGKTSTKNMLAALLAERLRTTASPASFNNDIGVPCSILGAPAQTEALVLELGTSAPGEIAALCAIAAPTAGILTGIGASHLAGLGCIEGVAEEKGALVEAVPAEGFVVLGASCRFTPLLRERARARTITFGLDGQGDLTATDLCFHPWGTAFQLRGTYGEQEVHLPLLGQHMVQNLLACLAACQGLGLRLAEVLPAVARLGETRGRLARREAGGVLILDDTYNANPESVRAGLGVLAALPGRARRALVLGDMHELGPASNDLHAEVGAQIAGAGLDLFVTVGRRARAAAEGALAEGMDATRVHAVPDLDAAQQVLLERVSSGDVLLIKASRAAGLEALVTRLEEACSTGCSVGSPSG